MISTYTSLENFIMDVGSIPGVELGGVCHTEVPDGFRRMLIGNGSIYDATSQAAYDHYIDSYCMVIAPEEMVQRIAVVAIENGIKGFLFDGEPYFLR